MHKLLISYDGDNNTIVFPLGNLKVCPLANAAGIVLLIMISSGNFLPFLVHTSQAFKIFFAWGRSSDKATNLIPYFSFNNDSQFFTTYFPCDVL